MTDWKPIRRGIKFRAIFKHNGKNKDRPHRCNPFTATEVTPHIITAVSDEGRLCEVSEYKLDLADWKLEPLSKRRRTR